MSCQSPLLHLLCLWRRLTRITHVIEWIQSNGKPRYRYALLMAISIKVNERWGGIGLGLTPRINNQCLGFSISHQVSGSELREGTPATATPPPHTATHSGDPGALLFLPSSDAGQVHLIRGSFPAETAVMTDMFPDVFWPLPLWAPSNGVRNTREDVLRKRDAQYLMCSVCLASSSSSSSPSPSSAEESGKFRISLMRNSVA